MQGKHLPSQGIYESCPGTKYGTYGVVPAVLGLGPRTLPHIWAALERFMFNSPEYAPRGGIE